MGTGEASVGILLVGMGVFLSVNGGGVFSQKEVG